MSKLTSNPSNNSVTITGKLNDVVVREGTSKVGGKPYRAGTATIRVDQTYGGKNEVSEVPVQFIAMKFKKDGTSNPAYESLGQLTTQFKSIQNYGFDQASRIRVNGRSGNISENMFVGRDAEQVVSSWRINASFFNAVGSDSMPANADCATFNMDIFIMSITREMTPEGEETGRLKIRGGVVQWGNKLDQLDFFVEDPTAVEYIERTWSMNDTVNVVGRIRYTSQTVAKSYHSENSWGEAIPETTTQVKRELIITHGSDEPFDEDLAYAPEDIQVLNADRNNRKEQLKIEARSKATQKASKPIVETSNYGWEE